MPGERRASREGDDRASGSRRRRGLPAALLFTATCTTFLLLHGRGDAAPHFGTRVVRLDWSIVLASLAASSARAALVCGTLWLVRSVRPLVLSVAFLTLPYLLFFAGWMRPGLGIPLCGLLLVAAVRVCRREVAADAAAPLAASHRPAGLDGHFVAAGLVAFGWVVLSGAGGFGHQNVDYRMHNGRLADLIAFAWPVHYGADQNLVFNLAYYLPSALIGKLFGTAVGFESLFFWTLLGLLIVVAWIFELLRTRSFLAILPFVVFGGLDWLGVWWLDVSNRWLVLEPEWPEWWWNDHVGGRFFVGGILSNTFSLFWSPHQVIAGWLVIAALTKLHLAGRKASAVFLYVLCSFWSPLILIALTPFLVVLLLEGRLRDWREIASFENVAVAPLIAVVLGLFYLGGSALVNQAGWLWQVVDLSSIWPSLLLFYALEFGAYALCAWPFVRRHGRRAILWFLTAVAVLVAAPLYRYGAFSDLACRGTVPALFVLVLAITGVVGEARREGRRLVALATTALLAFGATTAIPELWVAVSRFGETQPAQSVPTYEWAFEQLGPDSSLFARRMARR